MNANLKSELLELRHELHAFPEVSGEEKQTAGRIINWLEACSPTEILSGLGGHGVAAIYDSGVDGPTVLFRCELDALPIFEVGQLEWRSKVDGKGHLCGHDGHMSILCGLAKHLDHNGPKHGRIILLYQPAEEDGAGARAVISDPNFSKIQPDFAFALHNLPGAPMHSVGVKSGPLNFASEGLAIELMGKTSHASHPEDGISPADAVAELIGILPKLPEKMGLTSADALVTLVHAKLGVEAFGIAPANANVMATLRSIDNELQKKLMTSAEHAAVEIAEKYGLKHKIFHGEAFAACTNNAEATDYIRASAAENGSQLIELDKPFRWSEDFGLFDSVAKSALFVLGAGESTPQLHNPDYDFPDELIETGTTLFAHIARDICG